jgi:hypothetical protein
MAIAGIEGAVDGNGDDFLIGRDLVQEFGQHRRVANIATGDLGCADLQRRFIAPDVILRQTRRCGAAMLVRVPLPSPSALMPVLSIKCCSGPSDPM